MNISLLCLALFLSRVLGDHPMNVQDAENQPCVVNVSENSMRKFNETLEAGKKVIFFQIRYDSQQAYDLTKAEPNNHFANPNKYMWLYDGDDGLPVFMNAPYDFQLLSLFILSEYTAPVDANMTVSKSCNGSTVSRVDFLRLVFHQLLRIINTAQLPGKRTSAYICYDINNRNKLKDYSFMAYKRLGMNREVLLSHCCKITNAEPSNNGTDLCKGETKNSSKGLDLQNCIGAFLFAFLPFAFGFISKAKLPGNQAPFTYVRMISDGFDKGEQFQLPFGTENCWINEHDDRYSIFTFLKWLFLFDRPSFLASRIRRSLTVFMLLLALLIDFVVEYFVYRDQLWIYLKDNVPLGYKSLMFGIKESADNTDYIFGGPFIWFSSSVIFGLIVINIPDRLCQTIAHSTIHQQETFTFLVQDIKFLQRYGSLKEANLEDYELLYAIQKASLLTSLNPWFWFAVIKRWFHRCRKVYNCFDGSSVFYQLIGVCVTLFCTIISFFLCIFELLLCIIYYGCPQFVVWKAIPHSYTQLYICPLIRRRNIGFKILGVVLFLMSMFIYVFLFIISTYFFLTSFQLLSSYVMFTVIALIAKPDAIAYVLLISVFFYFVISIVKSVSETYKSLLKVSIKLADSVCTDFVYTRLGEKFIYNNLFERIVQQHHPIRFEVAKAVTKVTLVSMFFISCIFAFKNISLNLSTYIKIGLLVLTTMLPKITTVLKESVLDSRWKIERILETIYAYKLVNFDNQNNQGTV